MAGYPLLLLAYPGHACRFGRQAITPVRRARLSERACKSKTCVPPSKPVRHPPWLGKSNSSDFPSRVANGNSNAALSLVHGRDKDLQPAARRAVSSSYPPLSLARGVAWMAVGFLGASAHAQAWFALPVGRNTCEHARTVGPKYPRMLIPIVVGPVTNVTTIRRTHMHMR